MKQFIKIVGCLTLLIFFQTSFTMAGEAVFFYYTDPAYAALRLNMNNSDQI